MRDSFAGEHILIRKARMTDLDAVYENVYSDRELLSTMYLAPSDSKEQAAERLKRTIAFQKDKMLYFVALKETDEVIGLCGIRPESDGIFSEAGLAIARKYQGRGYGKEMLRLLLDYAFTDCGAEQFAYYAMDFNTKSKALAKHFGFHYDQSRKETREYDGKEFTLDRFLLSKEEYQSTDRKIK